MHFFLQQKPEEVHEFEKNLLPLGLHSKQAGDFLKLRELSNNSLLLEVLSRLLFITHERGRKTPSAEALLGHVADHRQFEILNRNYWLLPTI